MTDKTEWRLPVNDDEMARAGERFRVAGAAIRQIREWRSRQGDDPPDCIKVRAQELGMNNEQYFEYWKSFVFLDPKQEIEVRAIEDWAIHQVQPEWKRNPNPRKGGAT